MKQRKSAVFFLLLFSCSLAAADFPRQELSVGFIGAFQSGGFANRNLPGVAMTYRVRLHSLFAAEAGLEYVRRPVGSVGDTRYPDADDNLFLIPFGPRLTLTPQESAWTISLGGGGAYLNHTFGYENPAIGLVGSSKWGAWAGVGAGRSLASGRFRLGGNARYYRFGPHLHIFTLGPEFSITF